MIEKKELKRRVGFFLFAVGAWLTAVSLRSKLSETIPIPDWLLGIIIMIVSLYFFDLK